MRLCSTAAKLAATGFISVFTVTLAGVTFDSTALAIPTRPLVIYGDDNRLEVYEEEDPAKQILAESVVAIMPSAALESDRFGQISLRGANYGEENELCLTEKFTEQSAPAYCSGFLVADNIVATAGHCVQDKDFCSDAKLVFNFMIDKEGRDPNVVRPEDVYGCKKVLHEEAVDDGADFALIELDRPVVGLTPLSFAKTSPAISDSVFVIGHPVGLPAKVAAGATVRADAREVFVANLDTFGGNSGSAVFNDNYEVAGILVRGENDFVRKGGCYVSYSCTDSSCRGEDVTKSGVISKVLTDILEARRTRL